MAGISVIVVMGLLSAILFGFIGGLAVTVIGLVCLIIFCVLHKKGKRYAKALIIISAVAFGVGVLISAVCGGILLLLSAVGENSSEAAKAVFFAVDNGIN